MPSGPREERCGGVRARAGRQIRSQIASAMRHVACLLAVCREDGGHRISMKAYGGRVSQGGVPIALVSSPQVTALDDVRCLCALLEPAGLRMATHREAGALAG